LTESLQSHIKLYVSLILVPLKQVLTYSRFLSPQYFNELLKKYLNLTTSGPSFPLGVSLSGCKYTTVF